MKITPTTTDEQIVAPIIAAREAAAAVIAKGSASDTIAAAVNSIAAAEGAAQINHVIRNMMQHGASVTATIAAVQSHAMSDPDDTWSGRTNDVRRAKHQGMIRRAREATEFGAMRRMYQAVGPVPADA